MKYKVGDKVRVRMDLTVNKVYGICLLNKQMVPLMGKTFTIIYADEECYKVSGDNGWYYSDEMLEPIGTES